MARNPPTVLAKEEVAWRESSEDPGLKPARVVQVWLRTEDGIDKKILLLPHALHEDTGYQPGDIQQHSGKFTCPISHIIQLLM